MLNPRTRFARRAALSAAVALIPLPAYATTYNLTNATLIVPANTSSYTAADTLNTSTVTFNSSVTATLAPAINLLAGTTSFINTGSLTLTGPLSGTATFLKSGTGTLNLTSPAPLFTGPASIASGATLRLTDPLALGPANAPTPITFTGILDVSGSLPARPVYLNNTTIANNDSANPAVVSSLSIANLAATAFTFNGPGDLTFSSPISFTATSLTKNGINTVTYAAPATFSAGISLNAGTLRLGIDSPFAGSSALRVSSTLDLNGFTPGCPVYVSASGIISNSNLSSTPTLTSFPAGSPTFSGPGDILLNTPVSSFTKTGTGTLTLNAPNTTFSSSIVVTDGAVRLGVANALGNSTSTPINLQSTSQTLGTFDLNGFPAPAGRYNFTGGALLNNNPASTSNISSSASLTGTNCTIGGAGSISSAVALPSNLTKIGAGTLTLATAQSFSDLQINAGTVVLAPTGSYTNTSISIASNATLDLNGRTSSPFTLFMSDNASIVNNNTSSPVTMDTGLGSPSGTTFNLGGAGTLNLTNTQFNSKSLVKIGAGLLTLPTTFNPKDVTLRQGTLQIQSPTQLSFGSPAPLYFHGGTLLIGPFNSPYYSFPSAWYVYDEGATIDATVDTSIGNYGTIASPLTATTGTLTKTGSATLTLYGQYQTGVNFTVNQGLLSFFSINAALFSKSTLTLNADNAFACTDTLTGQLTVGTLAGAGNLSAVSLKIAGNGTPTTYSGAYSSPSLSITAPADAFIVTGNLNTNTAISGALTLGNGGTAGSASGTVNISTNGTLSLNRSDSFTLPATLSGTGTLTKLGSGAATLTLSSSSSLKLNLQAGQLRLSPTTPTSIALSSLTLSSATSFDLSTHNVSLTATAAYLPTLRSYLATGELFSSASDTTHTLGYAFLTNHILISLTSPGDANLDGIINADDYALLDQGFAQNGSVWTQGDFNYDGVVNQSDYLLLDRAFAQQTGTLSPSLLAERESQFGDAYVSELLTSIPEPSSIAACLFAISLLPRRRRAFH
jgi:autotransporter-associated beta strand protein